METSLCFEFHAPTLNWVSLKAAKTEMATFCKSYKLWESSVTGHNKVTFSTLLQLPIYNEGDCPQISQCEQLY